MIRSEGFAHFSLTKIAIGLAAISLHASANALETKDFITPPQAAKPLVWWHWMNGNVTQSGIKKDLAWMDKVGIGGVQNFDAQLMTPKVVDDSLEYMTPQWKNTFEFALAEAKKHNFEFAIAASPGWSETGGPWVKPEQGMKKLSWREVTINAATKKAVRVPTPPTNTGVFQDFYGADEMFADPTHSKKAPPVYYKDIAVLAVPIDGQQIQPLSVTTNNEDKLDLAVLTDNSFSATTNSSSHPDSPLEITFDFGETKTVRSMSLAMPSPGMFFPAVFLPTLQASEDGKTFNDVTTIPIGSTTQTTVSFPNVNARYMRIVMSQNPNGKFSMPSSSAPGAAPPPGFQLPTGEKKLEAVNLLEIAFFSQAKVHRFEDKAGFGIVEDYYPLSYQHDEPGVAKNAVIDITDKLNADGTLNWHPENGLWKIIRLGYSLTGKENHPATEAATGLEVDKYDADAVNAYIAHYLDMYKDASGKFALGDGIKALLNDSIEVGASNWTPKMFEEFKQRRGYDLTPWLPALVGVIIEDAQQTDKFLYDFRLTLGEMLADNHYAVISKRVKEAGLIHYSEALENGRPTLGDGMRIRRNADIPMAAMWAFDTQHQVGPKPQYWADIREAASVAHIYGQNLVAAESLTSAASPWAFSPRDLQPMIDMEFALGMNRPIIHTSVHQPNDNGPGLSLFVFGQYFNRLDTWAEYAKPWVTYISRNAYMLQQGHFKADVAYFYGEETPPTALYNDKPSEDVPQENAYDYVNNDVITALLQNCGSDLCTDSGQRYAVLYLGGTSQYMTLPVLERIAELVANGATVIGKKPVASPSLTDNPKRFDTLANRLWSGKTGKGRIIVADNVQDGVEQAGVAPDFRYKGKDDESTLYFVHRQTDSEDIYYYTNRKNREEPVTFSFNVSGKTPYHYNAVTGDITALTSKEINGVTVIEKTLAPYESGYVVFGESPSPVTHPTTAFSQSTTLKDEWLVSFQENRGAPAQATLSSGNWAESDNDGIRYFSGTASYTQTFTIDKAMQGKPVQLHIEDVRDVVEVVVNGEVVDTLWKPPFHADVSHYLSAGENTLTLNVTNLWVNRLIGDAQPDVKQKYTFTTLPTYVPDAPLRPSGLLGAVTLKW
ncbi:glycosyl hydrolase [Alteromonas gilva]|uniref:Glycosyl hydrolase n=1 Tax=Alteromonas gilva TaxID=2987522 RepID=A0ABT5L7M6_9ALTE|nr:glycosyl hydrolase [Alteromonas gilva]MDC8833052.1 glycosyl hydrolase [Alteromonas gilva]